MNSSDKICAYDTLFTNNHIQMLKIILGNVSPAIQGKLAVYIKFLELQHTLRMLTENTTFHLSPSLSTDTLLEELLPYCDRSEKEQIQSLINLLQNFNNMQEMMEVFQMMQEMAPEFTSTNDVSQMMDMMQSFF